jgi:hypothetical protein
MDLNAYAQIEKESLCCCSAASGESGRSLAALLARYNVNDYAASVQVYAVKTKPGPDHV